MPDKLLTTRELQERLQLDRVTIYRMVREGELPALRVGGQWRFSNDAITTWLRQQDRTRTPAPQNSDAPALRLSDLIPLKTLQAIQDQFAAVLGLSSFITDLDGQPLVACSRCSHFCRLIHTTEAGMDACRSSWRSVARSAEAGAAIHTCHAGVHYASAPLTINGQRLGMVTAGQFLTAPPDPADFRHQALAAGDRIGVDGGALAAAGDSLEVVSAHRALQITALLAVIANALSSIGYQSFLARQTLTRIAQLSDAAAAASPG